MFSTIGKLLQYILKKVIVNIYIYIYIPWCPFPRDQGRPMYVCMMRGSILHSALLRVCVCNTYVGSLPVCVCVTHTLDHSLCVCV